MKQLLGRILIVLFFAVNVSAQQTDRKYIPISPADLLRYQTTGSAVGESTDLNERLRVMSGVTRFSQDYLLGPGDGIVVTVFGIDDLEMKELTLDSKGEISLPFISNVKLLGLTARESEVKVATLYEASVMKNPQVSVRVKEYRSQFINVLGAVFKPGTYQLTRRVYLVDALAMAGGLLAEKAESKVYVHRASVPDPGQTDGKPGADSLNRIEVDLVQLLEKGDISLNIPIYAGDVVSVPELVERFIYVLGDVNGGGAFEIRDGEKFTLSQALASAGGLMVTAKTSNAAVIRQQEDGSSLQIPVDVKKVLKGESEDIELARNDVLFVPGSTTKTIGKGILNSVGSVMSSLIYIVAR